MGTQQLLFIILAVIVVGIAIAVAILYFKGNDQSANRDAVITDLENLATSAEKYYRKPVTLAGGGYDFLGFNFLSIDTGNENGSYSVTTSVPTGAAYEPGNAAPIGSSTQTIYIIGCGNVIGNDGVDPVKVYLQLSQDSMRTFVLN